MQLVQATQFCFIGIIKVLEQNFYGVPGIQQSVMARKALPEGSAFIAAEAIEERRTSHPSGPGDVVQV